MKKQAHTTNRERHLYAAGYSAGYSARKKIQRMSILLCLTLGGILGLTASLLPVF